MKNKSHYLWGLLGKLGPQFLYLITTSILARLLTPDDFGKIGILAIFTSIAQTLLEGGLGGSLIKEKNITRLDCSTIFVFNLVISILLYAIIFFLSPTIEDYYAASGLAIICRLLCLVIIINAFGQIAQTLLFRNLKFKYLTISSILSVSIGAIAAISSAYYFKWGVFSLVAYQLTQSSCYVIINWYNSPFKISFRFSINSFKRLFSFGFYTTIIGVIESGYENIITSLFGKYIGLQQAGYLTQAKRIETTSCNALVGTINSVSFPVLTQLKDSPSVFRQEADALLHNISLLILPILLSVALYSKEIISLIFGPNWIGASQYLKILMWIGCIFILESTIRNFIKSLCHVKRLLITVLIKRSLGLIIILCCIAIDCKYILYGYLVGAAIGLFANILCYTAIQQFKFTEYLKTILSSIWPVLILYIIGNIIYSQITMLCINIACWLIIIGIYYLWVLKFFDIYILQNLHNAYSNKSK